MGNLYLDRTWVFKNDISFSIQDIVNFLIFFYDMCKNNNLDVVDYLHLYIY